MSDARAAPPLFTGVAVALVSLFDDDERLLVEETAELAAALAAEGARAIMVAGSTGEAWFLTTRERVALCERTRAVVPDEVPVLVGSGHPDPAVAVRLTRDVCGSGADAVIAISPRGGNDTTAYYEALVEAASGVPVLAYHFPRVSPPGVPVELLGGMPIAGLKDSSGDAERLAAELDGYGGPVYVGSPLLLATAGAFGAAGAIVALANLAVALCVAAFNGDLDAQRALLEEHKRISPDLPRLLKQMVAEQRGTPVGIRTAPPAEMDHEPWPAVRLPSHSGR